MATKHVHLPSQTEAAHGSSLGAPLRAGAGEMTSPATSGPPQEPPTDDTAGREGDPAGVARVPGRLRRACTFLAVHAVKGAATSVGGLLVTAAWVYLSQR